jgi:hypothetical protein
MSNIDGKHILSPLECCLRHLEITSTIIKRFKINIQEKTIWQIRNITLTFRPSVNTQKATLLFVKCFCEQDLDTVEFEEFSLEN